MGRILIMAGVLLIAAQTSQAFKNEPTGFRGISWGTPLSPGTRPVGGRGREPRLLPARWRHDDDRRSSPQRHLLQILP
jgi:hypothetical protein